MSVFKLDCSQKDKIDNNTPGTKGWSSLRDRMLAVKENNYLNIFIFLCLLLFTHFGDTPEGEIFFPPFYVRLRSLDQPLVPGVL